MESTKIILLMVLAFGMHENEFGVQAKFDFKSLNHLRSKTPADIQRDTAAAMVQRIVGDRSSDFLIFVNFSLSVSGKDTFQLQTVGSKLQITGSSGVAVAIGFYYYLKTYCNSQFTWAGQNINLATPLTPVSGVVQITTPDRFRYYKNVCTESYSFAFMSWNQWERHIDWMALNGINLPLAFVGQEAIFQRLYMNLGIKYDDLETFFGGPAFLAWSRMGNIRGWGGPLPQMWITNRLLLQHQILERMRNFGMVTVLPGFAGHVPAAFTKVFPQANVTRLGGWAGFNLTYSHTYLLDFNDPLFKVVGAKLIQLMQNEFGVDHIYNADTFNEMTPASSDPAYIASTGRAVFEAMQAGDPDAIWLMQGWLFVNDKFWNASLIKALLTSVPQGRMIILDLFSELLPVYQKTESYYGQPFIWCMLHNFGGTMELYGALKNINEGPPLSRAFPNSTMIGIGLTPEGIFQNEVIYEFMNENAWRTQPRNIDTWMSTYVKQRYGFTSQNIDTAWQLLKTSVYNCTDSHHDNDHVLITRRPSPFASVTSDVWYNPQDLFQAWDLLVLGAAEFTPNELYIYDLVDVSRNSLQILSLSYYTNVTDAFNKKDVRALITAGQGLIELLLDMETLLASDRHFLLGNWIADAVSWATDMNEQMLLQYNAKNQISLWGPDGQIVDYASKQWAGIFKDYYVPRWQFFVNWLAQLVKNGTKFDNYMFVKNLMPAVEIPFTTSLTQYPTTPKGDPVAIVKQMHSKYRSKGNSGFFYDLARRVQADKRGKETRFKIPSRKMSVIQFSYEYDEHSVREIFSSDYYVQNGMN